MLGLLRLRLRRQQLRGGLHGGSNGWKSLLSSLLWLSRLLLLRLLLLL